VEFLFVLWSSEMMVEIEYVKDERAYVLTSSVILPVSRATLFDFFSDAFQLEAITPPWLKFRVLTLPPIHIQSGALIDYRLQLHGLPSAGAQKFPPGILHGPLPIVSCEAPIDCGSTCIRLKKWTKGLWFAMKCVIESGVERW
jgi:hypothetical protein